MIKWLARNKHIVVCLAITLGFLALTATVFRPAFSNIANSAVEFWNSMIAYFRFLFLLEQPTYIPIAPPCDENHNALPINPSEISSNFGIWFRLLFNGANFRAYLGFVGNILLGFMRVFPLVILLYIVLKRLVRRWISKHNTNYNRDTVPLKTAKKAVGVIYVPPKQYLSTLFSFTKQSSFPKIWLLIWFFNLNVFAVILSLFATMMFFFVSLNFTSIYYFLFGAVGHLLFALRTIPWPFWIILALWRIDVWRKRKALERLNHMENMNKGFINERSICSMFVGSMGKGKTTLLTDVSLSTEAIFRHKAHDMMLDIDMKFPNFPWIIFEKQIQEQMESGRIFNLATAGAWVSEKEKAAERSLKFADGFTPKQLERLTQRALKRGVSWETVASEFYPDHNVFEYEYYRYDMYYDDKKTLTFLFDALRDYAKLYFIYILTCSLIISNYSVRTDFLMDDAGNFPEWDLDFFNRDTKHMAARSRHSKVLDFDMLRLGKKVIENNKNAAVFEFGVISITEVGKERGNQFKAQEIKEAVKQLRDLEKAKTASTKDSAELRRLTKQATQLTDKFNDSLKLIRHKCTIGGFPFARVFLDEQRPESLGADARDLCEIVHIRDKSDTRLAMPFHFVGELLYAFTFPKFRAAYQEYRFNRGDNTLFMHLLKKIGAGIHQAYTRIYNRFGYHVRMLAVEDGATGQVLKESPYYLSTKKIYSNRFATDAYGDIFAEGLKECRVGVRDLDEYADVKASEAELRKQNSYFVEDLVRHKNIKEEQNEEEKTD